MSTRRNFKFTHVIQIYGIRWQSDDDTSARDTAIRIHIQRGVEVCVKAWHFSARKRRRPPIRHRDPFAAIESRKLFFSRKSSIIDKSLLFSSAFFSWELIILRERFYFRFIIIENRTISSGVLENEEYFFKFLSLSRIFFAKWAWRVATIIQK